MDEKNKKTEDKKVNLPVREIDLPKIDVTKHIGKKVKIESADVYEGTYGFYVKVLTKTVETIGTGNNAKEIRASKIFGLQQDADGIYGYGADTKLGMFLKKYKASELKDLIGKEVTLQLHTADNGTEFLTFV